MSLLCGADRLALRVARKEILDVLLSEGLVLVGVPATSLVLIAPAAGWLALAVPFCVCTSSSCTSTLLAS
jgi:hypothetical protein